MLTSDIIKANTALAGLTEEQINAITTLSENDENSVIAKKTGEIYGALDADILAVTGVEKIYCCQASWELPPDSARTR